MSNQTVGALKALYMKAWELHRCNPPRDNGRSLQAIWINDLSALVDQFVREQQALPDREAELLAWINRLENTLDTSDNYKLYLDNQEIIKNQVAEIERLKAQLRDSVYEKTYERLCEEYSKLDMQFDVANDQIAQLQQQLESLKQKVSEHNEGLAQQCRKYNGCLSKCSNCPRLHMIDMGEQS